MKYVRVLYYDMKHILAFGNIIKHILAFQGTYCERQSSAPVACPSGTYNDAAGGYVPDVCKPCSAGTYNYYTVSTP